MTDEYKEYLQDKMADAENALFELRNALRGTGGLPYGRPNKYDNMAIQVDNFRTSVVMMAHRLSKEG